MTPDAFDEYCRFTMTSARLTWTDFERAKALRKHIRSCLARLDRLRLDPKRNAIVIEEEQARLSAVARELAHLEKKLQIA